MKKGQMKGTRTDGGRVGREEGRGTETEFKGVEMEVEGAVERQEESPGGVYRIRDVSGAREASPRNQLRRHSSGATPERAPEPSPPPPRPPAPPRSRTSFSLSRTYRFLRKGCFPEVESYAVGEKAGKMPERRACI